MATKKSTKVVCTCAVCQKQFLAYPSRLRKGGAKSCSVRCRGLAMAAPLAVRFAKRISPPDVSGCVLWTGPVDYDGYGHISSKGPRKRPLCAHRVAWELARGPIPAGLFVLHRCDVRRCVNVDHLFLGRQGDNMRDMARKGRGRKRTISSKPWLNRHD